MKILKTLLKYFDSKYLCKKNSKASMKLKIDSLERLKHKCFWKKILGNIQMSKTRNDDKVKTLIEVSINLLTK